MSRYRFVYVYAQVTELKFCLNLRLPLIGSQTVVSILQFKYISEVKLHIFQLYHYAVGGIRFALLNLEYSSIT